LRLSLLPLFCLKAALVSAQSGGYGYSCEPVVRAGSIVVVGTVLSAQTLELHIDGVPVSGRRYTVVVTQRWFGSAPDTLTAVLFPGGHCTVLVPSAPGSQVVLNLWPNDDEGLIIGTGSRALRAGDHDLSSLGAVTP